MSEFPFEFPQHLIIEGNPTINNREFRKARNEFQLQKGWADHCKWTVQAFLNEIFDGTVQNAWLGQIDNVTQLTNRSVLAQVSQLINQGEIIIATPEMIGLETPKIAKKRSPLITQSDYYHEAYKDTYFLYNGSQIGYLFVDQHTVWQTRLYSPDSRRSLTTHINALLLNKHFKPLKHIPLYLDNQDKPKIDFEKMYKNRWLRSYTPLLFNQISDMSRLAYHTHLKLNNKSIADVTQVANQNQFYNAAKWVYGGKRANEL